MAEGAMNFEFKMPKDLAGQFSEKNMKMARQKAVEAAGMVWADETKEIVLEDDHIDTSLFINSIGYVTNVSGKKDGPKATEADVVYEMVDENEQTTLKIGSSVPYAPVLEKKYNVMARGLDRAQDRMNRVGDQQIKRILGI